MLCLICVSHLFAASSFKVLVFSKTLGFRHTSIPDGIAAIESLGVANNFTVNASESSGVFTDANLAQYKVLVFLNPSGEIFNTSQKAAFQKFIRKGGGFAGIHNPSAYVLENWGWYDSLISARYKGEVTGPMKLNVLDKSHPSTQGFPNTISFTGEAYNFFQNPKTYGVTVLISLDETSISGGTMSNDHPISWYHLYDGGRIWYTNIGADSPDYKLAWFQKHILGGIEWAAGPVTSVQARPRVSAPEITIKNYPNPFDAALTFRLPFAAKGALRIYNSQGRLMRSAVNVQNEITINTTGWAPGVYLVRTVSEGKVSERRLLLQK